MSLSTIVRLLPSHLEVMGLNLDTVSPLAGIRLCASTLFNFILHSMGVSCTGPPILFEGMKDALWLKITVTFDLIACYFISR